ncbi:hypothetical protein HPP92_000046 [Vanilla planifolia]|uniref:Uncharacterized protein n=1 Tax=Vanilla planifolia TaxID=51239 RepID=A0A835VFQ8_VANPL|nr:hypothetical protein HPP92_000046 [Vanilla planifolia]
MRVYPKGTTGSGKDMKQGREMLEVGYQQSPHFTVDDNSRSIDHWRKFFRNAGLDIFELIENAVFVAIMDYPKEFRSKQQTKNFVDPSQDHVNPSILDEEVGLPSPPLDETELLSIQTTTFEPSKRMK